MTNDEQIELLEKEKRAQWDIITAANLRIEEIKKEIGKVKFEEKYPIGSIREFKGIKYKISGYSECLVYANKIKKDGSVCERENNFYVDKLF